MRKILISIGAVVIAIVTWFVFIRTAPTAPSNSVKGGFIEQCFDNVNNSCGTLSSTTPVYLSSSGASTTLAFYAPQAESIDLNLWLIASSSSSNLLFSYGFSNDNTNWYGEDGQTALTGTTVTEGATSVYHTWTPGNQGTSTRNITIKPTASKYIRVQFQAVGANAAVYAQALAKVILMN